MNNNLSFNKTWEQRKLSDVADVRDGTHDSPKFYNDGFPLVTSKNLKGGSIDFSDCSFISEQDFNEINKRSKVDPGDILFGMIGTIGNPAIVEHTGFAIKNVALIKEGNIINNRFIYHLLSSKVFENYIARENAGGTQKFIALNQIRNFDFLAPALVEQNKIIELLDCISQNITLHQCKLEKLKLTKKALLQKLFPKNGKHIPEIRFKGFTDAWEQRKLGEFVKIISGDAPSTFISGRCIYVKVDDLNYSDRIQLSSSNLVNINPKAHLVNKGATIFPKRGAAIMTNKVRIMGKDGYLDTNMMALIPEEIDKDFLFTFIQKTGLYKIADTSTIPQINNKHIEPYMIQVPNDKEQECIGVVFEKIDKIITLHQRKLERLQEVKKGLLQKMFV